MSPALFQPTPPVPPGDTSDPGWLLRVVRDQRVAFLGVAIFNTAFGFSCFAGFLLLFGHERYLLALLCAHVISVLMAFVLYRHLVFRVHGHVLADLWRFETVYLSALAVNLVVLPLLVELVHLQVLLAQALVVLLTSVMSWVGHRHFSFRRTSPAEGPQR